MQIRLTQKTSKFFEIVAKQFLSPSDSAPQSEDLNLLIQSFQKKPNAFLPFNSFKILKDYSENWYIHSPIFKPETIIISQSAY
jgi:hypothetical protein